MKGTYQGRGASCSEALQRIPIWDTAFPQTPKVPMCSLEVGCSEGLGISRPGLGTQLSSSAAVWSSRNCLPSLSLQVLVGNMEVPVGRDSHPWLRGMQCLCLTAWLQAGSGPLRGRGKGTTRDSDPHCHRSETEGLGCSHPGLPAYWPLGVPPPVTSHLKSGQVRNTVPQLL